jgi:GNAT superfamily N-acetyltransferase
MSAVVRQCDEPGAEERAAIARLHATIYELEQGWDARFAAYVDETLEKAAAAWNVERDRLWLADSADGDVVGSIAIVHAGADVAQLRWFIVAPHARGSGLGSRLLDAALDFCRERGYRRVFLLTTDGLEAAARLYRAAGFRLIAETPLEAWGAELLEQRYELEL